jgi:hypothetical protein
MTKGEFQVFVTKLHGFYGERFPALTSAMAAFWYESLRYTDEDIADLALHRWARQHTLKAPSLDEMLEQIEFVQEEERATQWRSAKAKGWGDALQEAAEAQAANPERSDDDATYGWLMAQLAERSIHPWTDTRGVERAKLTMEQRAMQCMHWAKKHAEKRPQLAEDLRCAARHFGWQMYMGTESDGGGVE